MMLGLVIAAAAIVVTGQIDPGLLATRQALPAFVPIMLPLAVLILPLMDVVITVVRRLAAGKSPFHPDRKHLHHRLLDHGHSHRRTVVILYIRSEEHTSELQSRGHLVCRLLLER